MYYAVQESNQELQGSLNIQHVKDVRATGEIMFVFLEPFKEVMRVRRVLASSYIG